MENPFKLVFIIATLATGLNVWYMIRSKQKHNECVKNRKCKKK